MNASFDIFIEKSLLHEYLELLLHWGTRSYLSSPDEELCYFFCFDPITIIAKKQTLTFY